MLFENENTYFSYGKPVNYYPYNNFREPDKKMNVLNAKEALMMGNAFKDLYKPYKHHKPQNLSPKNEREASLLKVQELDFIINDLNLYLDFHNNDYEMFELFKKYVEEKEKAVKEYERKYGPLEIENDMGAKYDWYKSPWPWDKGGSY